MKKFIQTKWFTFGTYLLLVLATLLIGFVLLQNNRTLKNVFSSFFEVAENRSFDYRQTLKVAHNQPVPNKDIVFLAIDDASLEMLWDKYGEWPIPRNVYADMINHIETQKPQAIIFDLLFIKSIRSSSEADKALVAAMNNNDNIYTGMTFDNQTTDVRLPIELPERLKLNIDNQSDVKIKSDFTNVRPILSDLINGSVHIGSTNAQRSSDGIIRKFSPIVKYKGDYYPLLSFGAASKYVASEEKNFTIDKNRNLLLGETKLPLTADGEVILNWYGKSGTHTVYPMYKLVKEMDANVHNLDFKDKIVIIGTTAMALQDNKSVPVQDGVYPGAEVHATFFNNILDNNFIKQTSTVANILIILGVVAIVGLIVMYSSSTVFSVLSTILFMIAYLFVSYYLMSGANLWIPVVLPTIAIVIAFALSYLAKYLIKSRDFEYQYKLATVDGLTELYNHRYFQDTLKNQIETAKRYGQTFSLIIVDIDFFKKFNDTYGHQAGDAVLRQVAQTLKKNSRTTDFVCRYGGEEMSIILPNTANEEAMNNANRLCKAIAERPFQLNATDTGNVTISLGVATFPDNAQTAQELIEYADKCLYYAKEHGRNQVGKYE
ncbi:MAG: diguanylate cyclase [Candidatus Gastranaerophilales bacterium]|nr:diguanylate cyclase [Candidatus Gastranaerophilales bacterium]MCM1072751.1 diguanylate cyclase [Bacteroides sp.]